MTGRGCQPVDVRTAAVSSSFPLLSGCFPVTKKITEMELFSRMMKLGCRQEGREREMSGKKSWQVVWHESEVSLKKETIRGRGERDDRAASTPYPLHIPFQSAEPLRTCQVLIIGTWRLRTPLPRSFRFPLIFASVLWLLGLCPI